MYLGIYRQGVHPGVGSDRVREFTKGVLVKGGLAIYVLKTNQIAKTAFTKPPFVNSRRVGYAQPATPAPSSARGRARRGAERRVGRSAGEAGQAATLWHAGAGAPQAASVDGAQAERKKIISGDAVPAAPLPPAWPSAAWPQQRRPSRSPAARHGLPGAALAPPKRLRARPDGACA